MKFGWLLAIVACAGCVKKSEADPRTAPARAASARPHVPFGSHTFRYSPGSILPSQVDQESLDQSTARIYDQWRSRYVKAGCDAGQYRVVADGAPERVISSEAHGLSMIILVLMAGHDAHAKTYFDGMLGYFLAHQSALTDGLMAWQQDETCHDVGGDHSFSVADLDIAYSLLLADKQWGSCGARDYRSHARRLISSVARGDLHRDGRYVLFGDWVDASQTEMYDAMRPSDFVPGHFRSYQRFMGQPWWLGVIDNGYWLLETVQARYGTETGLLPDYIAQADSEQPRPASAGFLEFENANRYDGHASSIPWRLGSDFLVSGDSRARRILARLNTFMRQTALDDPANIKRGFALDGTPNLEPGTMAFTAPLGVSAMVDADNQQWLDAIWKVVADAPQQTFSDDTARLVAMLLMSSNWWPPEHGANACAASPGSESR